MFLPQWFRPAPQRGCTAPVTSSQAGYLCASGEEEFFDIPLSHPYGLYSLPPEGSYALILPLEDSGVYAGVLGIPPAGLLAGEVQLFSAGGAFIALKNSGEVIINGLVITPDGKLLAKEET